MSDVDKTYNVVSSESVALGRFEIILDSVEEKGRIFPYSYVKHKASVGVLPIVGDKILLIRQYRHALKSYEYEIPGGGLEKGDTPEKLAVKELLEETGYEAGEVMHLGQYYPSPGATTEVTYLYAIKCGKRTESQCEPLEYIEQRLVSEEEFVQMIANGEFKHSMGLVAWLKYKMYSEQIGV